MAQEGPSLASLGTPGQVDGHATLQSDRGDETQALFMYQWSAGVTLLAAAVAGINDYTAIWCEHHDDLLGELPSGLFHAVQVKTDSTPNARWTCSDASFGDAIKKFAEHEAAYSARFERYVLFSNIKPYVPGATAKAPARLASSPVRVRDLCLSVLTWSELPQPYKASFEALVKYTGAAADVVFRVLRKLGFQSGPHLEDFREQLCSVLSGIPACKNFTVGWLEKVRDEVLLLVGKASSVTVPALDFYASLLQSDGRPEAMVRCKRIAKEDFEQAIRQHPGSGFRYANVGGHLQLGQASGQKERLRQKMAAGYVAPFFDALWMLAMSAEERLLAEANVDAEGTLRKTRQLESAMLVACKKVELDVLLAEPDERRRGLKILQGVFQKADELARHDRATVDGERAETLQGVAGLLSGSCKFAWGASVDGAGDGT
ncbi:MAG: dsDNA nuclease domain-containing protein [Roseateles sp.]|uniref:dsDNA nuclease domain-containing protein n=1 Tax=Roseateles sp. TaxID=1971397 RepID=UPI00403616CD